MIRFVGSRNKGRNYTFFFSLYSLTHFSSTFLYAVYLLPHTIYHRDVLSLFQSPTNYIKLHPRPFVLLYCNFSRMFTDSPFLIHSLSSYYNIFSFSSLSCSNYKESRLPSLLFLPHSTSLPLHCLLCSFLFGFSLFLPSLLSM